MKRVITLMETEDRIVGSTMTHLCVLCLLGIVAIFAAISAVNAGGNHQDEDNNMTAGKWYEGRKENRELGVAIVVRVQKTTFDAEEPVDAEMLIQNVSRKPQAVRVSGIVGSIRFASSGGTEEDEGMVTDSPMPMHFGRGHGDDEKIVLMPGEFFGRSVRYDAVGTGSFIISASYAPIDGKYACAVQTSPLTRGSNTTPSQRN